MYLQRNVLDLQKEKKVQKAQENYHLEKIKIKFLLL